MTDMEVFEEAERLALQGSDGSYLRALAMVAPLGPDYTDALKRGMGELLDEKAQRGLVEASVPDDGSDFDSYDYENEDVAALPPSDAEVLFYVTSGGKKVYLKR